MPTTITRLNPASAKIVIPQSVGRSAPRPLAAWLMLVGVLIPEAALRIDFGAKLTAGRVGIILLLIPALIELTKNTRRLVPSDFCACALAAWMLVAAAYVDWENSLSSAGAECLEFVGGYFVARGLLFGTAAIDTFIRVLKIVAAIAILLGFADTLSGRWIVYDTFVGVSLTADYRLDGVVRALSTFDHPILFGTFCTVSGIIFLFSERTTSLRMRWSIFCFLGCLSALSSAPLLSFLIGFGVRAYDLLLRQFAWRWMVLWSVVMVATIAILLAANHPIGWIISHLTFDPVSGYFRLLIWDNALSKIADQPLTGYGFNPLQDDILDGTVDSVWLVMALRFGVPMIALLMLTNMAAFLPKKMPRDAATDAHLTQLRSGFTTVLVIFALAGLSTHYWNYMWIFWGLCVGIRACLREQVAIAGGRLAAGSGTFAGELKTGGRNGPVSMKNRLLRQ